MITLFSPNMKEKRKLLKKEVKQLKGVYKKSYMDMLQYLSSFTFNAFEYQDYLLEIAGTCLENQMRNTPLEEVFDDYKQYCDEIIKHATHKSFSNVLLAYITLIISFITLYILLCTIYYLLFPTIFDNPFYFEKGLLYIGASSFVSGIGKALALFFFCIVFINRRTYNSKGTAYAIAMLLYGIAFILIDHFSSSILGNSLWTIPILHIFSVFIILSVVTNYITYKIEWNAYQSNQYFKSTNK